MSDASLDGSLQAASSSNNSARLFGLALGSVGVVYGDIGTSPLYALREATIAAGGEAGVSHELILGVLSLILWALIVTVTLKYVLILLHADNNGEGGTLTLMALAQKAAGAGAGLMLTLGILGAALFYGDSLITPAISVLSAIEGLKIATPAFDPYVLPLTVAILIGLFLVQFRGTARVANFFGPIMVVWFVISAIGGLTNLIAQPSVFAAFNPLYGLSFLVSHGIIGLVTLGAVFLSVTGAEALYADLGHFGRKPIQLAWFALVLPALVLNYLGQGALLLHDPKAIENPFFLLYPDWALIPIVVLATIATVIASQAVITGAYSLTRQAIQLGLIPRLDVRHTSETHEGQIYLPRLTGYLLIGVLLIVVLFRSSGALASAYGIAVTGTMVVTTIMAFVVVWRCWNWPIAAAGALILPFLFVDVTFLAANLLKVAEGGWVPLLLGGLIVVVMATWRRGTRVLSLKTRKVEVPLTTLIRNMERKPPPIVPGTAIFLTSTPDSAPTALLHNLKHNKILHEHNVILSIATADTPRVMDEDRVQMKELSPMFRLVSLKFGFMETPNVPRALALARKQGWQFDIMSTSFFVSRRALKPGTHSTLPRWQDLLFIELARTAKDATSYFHIPTGRVVEIGTQVTV
jgi:KUP system potassium uptake protein